MERSLDGPLAEADGKRSVPEAVIGFIPGGVGPGQRNNRGHKQYRATRDFYSEKSLNRSEHRLGNAPGRNPRPRGLRGFAIGFHAWIPVIIGYKALNRDSDLKGCRGVVPHTATVDRVHWKRELYSL